MVETSKKPTLKAFCLALLLLFPITAGAGSPYTPPLESPKGLTSSFGEYRGDHLHNGIDFSTAGVLRQPVKAVDAGTVHRVYYDPSRYGKTVIIQHYDGRRTWYSHLQSVSDSIRNHLGGSLRPGENITLNETLEISRGETLGFSGNTGSGPAHLHFVLQSSDGKFLNPLGRFQPKLPYNPSPKLRAINLHPLDGSSWIEGKGESVRFESVPNQPLEVWGTIGIDITVENNHRHTTNTSLPAEIIFKRNGTTIRELSFKKLTQKQQKEGVWTLFNGKKSNLSPTRYTLHITPYQSTQHWNGLSFDTAQKSGTFTVILRTRTGNERRYTFPYEVVPPPSPVDWSNKSVDDRTQNQLEGIRSVNSHYRLASLKTAQFARRQYSPPSYEETQNPELRLKTRLQYNRLRVDLYVENRWNGWPTLRVYNDNFSTTLNLLQVEPGHFVGWWTPELSRDGWYRVEAQLRSNGSSVSVRDKVYLQALQIDQPSMVISRNHRYSVYASGKGLVGNYFADVKPLQRKSIRDGLSYVEDPRIVTPRTVKSLHGLELTVDVSDYENYERIGIFQWNPLENRWSNPSYDTGITESIRVAKYRKPGTIALIKDTTKPVIKSPNLSESGDRLRFPVKETGSGIDRSTLRVTHDSKRLPAVWEADENRIIVMVRNMDKNFGEIKVSIRDTAGNKDFYEGKIPPE
jgi:hypothetical protein